MDPWTCIKLLEARCRVHQITGSKQCVHEESGWYVWQDIATLEANAVPVQTTGNALAAAPSGSGGGAPEHIGVVAGTSQADECGATEHAATTQSPGICFVIERRPPPEGSEQAPLTQAEVEEHFVEMVHRP